MSQCESRVPSGASGRLQSGILARFVWGLVLAFVLSLPGCASMDPKVAEEQRQLAAATRDVGLDHLRNGRTAMAIRKIRAAIELDPADPGSHLGLGEAYRRKGMLEESEAELLLALELSESPSDFNYQETVVNLSALYIQMERYHEAGILCDTLIDDPTFATPWRALTNRGWAEYRLGRLDLARASFEQAIDFHPRYSPAHLNLGIVEQDQRRWMQAIAHYELAVEGNRLPHGALAETNYRMAEAYIAIGQRGKAIEHFSMAIEKSPYGEWGEQSRSYLELLR